MSDLASPQRQLQGEHPLPLTTAPEGGMFAESEQPEQDENGLTTEDTFDRLVSTASVPNLAALFKKAVKAGAIQPQVHYN